MEMDPLELFEVEMPGEDYGAKKYREIIMDILQDLGLIRSIGRLYVYVDIKTPYFAVYGMIRGKQPPLKVGDVGDLVEAEGGYQITVEDEEHMANLIRVLWATYGRENVEQPDRNVLVVLSDESPKEQVEGEVNLDLFLEACAVLDCQENCGATKVRNPGLSTKLGSGHMGTYSRLIRWCR